MTGKEITKFQEIANSKGNLETVQGKIEKMKAKILQLFGVVLLLITALYVMFFKASPDVNSSIWLSEITYMFIGGALLTFAPHFNRKS